MRILTKLKLRFRGGDQVFVTKGENVIETAPDWIQKDPLFPLVVKDGTLVKIEAIPAVPGSGSLKKEEGPDVPPEDVENPPEETKSTAKKAKK